MDRQTLSETAAEQAPRASRTRNRAAKTEQQSGSAYVHPREQHRRVDAEQARQRSLERGA